MEKIIKKNKRGSSGMEPKMLTPSSDNINDFKYLNVLVSLINSRARMAEWSTQLVNTKCPFRVVGSIPTPGAANSKLNESLRRKL